MTLSSRETARDALAAILTAALVGVGKPVQQVYGYARAVFDEGDPVVSVVSGGTERDQISYSTVRPTYRFMLYAFVLYADSTGTYTDQQAEDILDTIEQLIAQAVIDNQANSTWQRLQISGNGTVDTVIVDGKVYRREIIPVEIEMDT